MAIDADVERRLRTLREGRIDTVGTAALAVAPATSTTITHPACSSTSMIAMQALSALAANSDVTRVVPGNGSFVITHGASANARSHRYVIFTDAMTH